MPKYYEEKEEDGQACGGVREDLRQCLLESPCVLQENKSPKQCLREGHCRSLQLTFFACKRSMSVSKMESMLVEIEFSLELDSRVGYQVKIQRKEGILKSLEETLSWEIHQHSNWSRA